jgi:hypothetical protein
MIEQLNKRPPDDSLAGLVHEVERFTPPGV